MKDGFLLKEYSFPGKTHPCEKCRLGKNAVTPRMQVTGKGRKRIWVHGEAPGAKEDKHGKQFHEQGAAGRLLRQKLRALDVDLDRDCWKDNGVRCRPPNNRTPTDTELKACQRWIIPDLINKRPEKILLFGGGAVKSLITTRLPGIGFDGVKKWVGWKIPDQQLRAWVYPLWHPQYLNYNKDEKALWLRFDQFLQEAVDHKEGFPVYDHWESSIRIVEGADDAASLITNLIRNKHPAAFDYEATGLKPHMHGHRIVSCSVCFERGMSYAFPMFDHKVFLARLKRWLRDPECPKYCQNKRMEMSWSRNTLGTKVRGIVHDTMEAAHILDNRPLITNLELQTYINYGITYKDETKKHLKPTNEDRKKHGANAINQIDKVPLDKLLLRNGADSLFTYWLAQDQMRRMPSWAREPYELFHNGADALANAHERGITVDVSYCKIQDKRLHGTIAGIFDNIWDSKEVKRWLRAGNQDFNPASDDQVKKLYNNVLHKDLKGVDKDVLQGIGTPFAENIIRYRHLKLLRNTYLGGFVRETINGIMRPYFPTHLVATYRGSSSDVNFTNIPVRDKKAQRITRTALKARSGRQLLDVDYGRIEVFMGYFNSRDPVLGEYLTTPGTDMHRDMAMQIYMLKEKQVTGAIRHTGKNGYVFPVFYGSYWGSTAPNCWNEAKGHKLADGTPLIAHLRDNGIKSLKAFEKHMQEVDEDFWDRRFRVYRDWKEDMWQFYQRHGYIELLTGFRCYWSPGGRLGPKEASNYPNQGPAFHALLWSLYNLDQRTVTDGWSSGVIGQIHDDMVWDIEPSELGELLPIIKKTMCEDIRERWPWIDIPLEVDAKITDIGGNWYEQKEIEI